MASASPLDKALTRQQAGVVVDLTEEDDDVYEVRDGAVAPPPPDSPLQEVDCPPPPGEADLRLGAFDYTIYELASMNHAWWGELVRHHPFTRIVMRHHEILWAKGKISKFHAIALNECAIAMGKVYAALHRDERIYDEVRESYIAAVLTGTMDMGEI